MNDGGLRRSGGSRGRGALLRDAWWISLDMAHAEQRQWRQRNLLINMVADAPGGVENYV